MRFCNRRKRKAVSCSPFLRGVTDDLKTTVVVVVVLVVVGCEVIGVVGDDGVYVVVGVCGVVLLLVLVCDVVYFV